MKQNMQSLEAIHAKVKELNRRNNLLKQKYEGDPKFARVQKRIIEAGRPSKIKSAIIEALQKIKEQTDQSVLQRNDILSNESYFTKQVARMVNKEFEDSLDQKLDYDSILFVSNLIVREYLDDYYNKPA